ncbi:MAG: hypothetical protein R2692_03610 [Microbacterium sp.]
MPRPAKPRRRHLTRPAPRAPRLDRADRARPRGACVGHRRKLTFARSLSSHREQRAVSVASRPRRGRSPSTTPTRSSSRCAWPYASKIVALPQGSMIRAGAAQYGWTIDLGAISKIWRRLHHPRAVPQPRIADAYAATPDLAVLLTAPYFVDALGRAQDAWRHIVGTAATAGIPAPAFSSSLAYYDGLRAKASPPAALIQGQRPLRRAHLPAHGQAGHLPHAVVGRPHRDRGRRRRTEARRLRGRHSQSFFLKTT